MSFNLFLAALLLLGACGVKGDPVAPKDIETPSLMQNYPDIQTDRPVDDVKKGIRAKKRRK